MPELLLSLFPILLIDALNPVLFAALLYATGSPRPVIYSSAMLLGHTCAYLAVGILAALGLDKLMARLLNPEPVDYVIGLLVGIACLYAALATHRKDSVTSQPDGELTGWSSFSLGAFINFVGAPFAVPYFAAIDQILRADLSVLDSLAVLAVYNAGYALPFAMIPALVGLAGDSCRPFLETINRIMTRAADVILPFILGLLGLALIADALLFYFRGEGLF